MYVSRLAACRAFFELNVMTNVFTSGLLAATYALAWVIFCEYLSGIDESLCWQNWATVLTPRMAITTLGAGFGAFSSLSSLR